MKKILFEPVFSITDLVLAWVLVEIISEVFSSFMVGF